jgi:hypothetical protein
MKDHVMKRKLFSIIIGLCIAFNINQNIYASHEGASGISGGQIVTTLVIGVLFVSGGKLVETLIRKLTNNNVALGVDPALEALQKGAGQAAIHVTAEVIKGGISATASTVWNGITDNGVKKEIHEIDSEIARLSNRSVGLQNIGTGTGAVLTPCLERERLKIARETLNLTMEQDRLERTEKIRMQPGGYSLMYTS